MKVKTDFLLKKLYEFKKKNLEEPKVKDLMSKDVVTIGLEESVVAAAELMLEHRIHALIVTDGKKPVGIIASYDLLLVMSISDYFDKETQVKDVMIKDLLTVDPEDSIEKALSLMLEYNIRLLAAVKDDELMGVVSLIDLILCFVDPSQIKTELQIA